VLTAPPLSPRTRRILQLAGTVTAVLTLLVTVAPVGIVGGALPSTPAAAPTQCASMSSVFLVDFCRHIDHVVFILMENHAYDNYFATYCLSLSAVCNRTASRVAPGTCFPQVGYTGNSSYPTGKGVCPKGSIAPWNYTARNLTTPDFNHVENSTVESICGTTENPACLASPPNMTGFWRAEERSYTPFGHYNQATIPIYWDMAQEYALGTRFFSSDPSYSLPNHWFVLAGQAPPQSEYLITTVKQAHNYLNQSNGTRTVQDLLNDSPSTTWKYYDFALSPYQTAIQPAFSGVAGREAKGNGSAYAYWNPLAARNESYNTSFFASHFVDRTLFLKDVAGETPGGLPNISWVIPGGGSDHPPSNITLGQSFVAQYVDAIESSKYWNSTAIFLSWDDYGGFFDNVGPPKLSGLNPLGLSIRVPLIVMSPYTPRGKVSHQVGYFDSILSLIEKRWGLGCVVPGQTQDCGAPVPSSYFNFTRPPRSPCLFPTNWTEAAYPDLTCHPPGADIRIDPSEWGYTDLAENETSED
jgi:phospholipase C